MTEATRVYGLIKPDFNASVWHDQVNGNFEEIDALLQTSIGIGNFVGVWTNSTNYVAQQRVFDGDDGTIWNCLVDNTSPGTGTFADDRAANGLNWNPIASLPFVRGRWLKNTVYAAGDVAFDPDEQLFCIAHITHTSNNLPTGTMRDDLSSWDVIADLNGLSVAVSSVNLKTGVVVIDSDDISDIGKTHKFATTTNIQDINDAKADIVALEASVLALQNYINSVVPTGVMWPWTSNTPPSAVNIGTTTPAWLVCAGGTIGNGASGSTLRANADMLNVYTHLWNNFGNTELHIQNSTGTQTTRGSSALNDFNANKRMPVPDVRGGAIYYSDGGVGRITVVGNSVPGAQIGAQNFPLANANLPANIPASFTGTPVGNHSHTLPDFAVEGTNVAPTGGSGKQYATNQSGQTTGNAGGHTPAGTVSVNPGSANTPVPTLAPGKVIQTMILKT